MDNDYDNVELIKRLKVNDFSAQTQLLCIYAPRLIAFAMKFELSREDAEEVVSQSLQKVIEKIDTYDTDKGAKFSTWVCQITKNATIDRLRQIQREQEKSGGPLESIEKLEEEGYHIGSIGIYSPLDNEGTGPEEIEHEILHLALDSLNSTDRQVLLEWAYGSSFKWIGQLIDKKEGTAKVIKHRALTKLREEYLRILASQEDGLQEVVKGRYNAIRGEL